MTFFFGDGFDCYRDITDAATYWDAAFGTTASLALSISGRFVGSRGVTIAGSNVTPYIIKTSSVNDAVHHISVAFQQITALSGVSNGIFFTLFDGATAQCTVAFRSDGAILLIAGAVGSGTTLATYAGAVAAINTWYQFEIEVVIHNTIGSISVRKNGNTSNDFSLGSLNTRASANSYANKIGMGCNWSSAGGQNIDDFLWRSDASSAAWISDVRCYTRMPAADSAVQFARSGSTIVPVTPFVQAATAAAFGSQARYNPFTATCSGTIGTTILSVSVGGTLNLKCALYSDNGGVPGTLLATANTLVNPVSGNNTFTFPSPPSVVQGTKYWMGFNEDNTITWNTTASGLAGAYTNSGISNSIALTSWPTSNPTSLSTGFTCLIFTAVITPTTVANANLVAEAVQDAGATYVLSSTNGQADLYTLQAVPSTPFLPVTIIGVTTRGLFSKSDAGTRNATVQLKSGGVTVAGVSTALPASSWQWIARNDLIDPATGAAWTPSGVNAALIGPSVTA